MKRKNDEIDKEVFGNIFSDLMRDQNSIDDVRKKGTPTPSSTKKTAASNVKVPIHKETDIISDLGRKVIQSEQKLFEISMALKETLKENEKLKAENENLRNGKIPFELQNINCKNCKLKETEYEKLKSYTKELQECIKENGFILLKDVPFENENYTILNKKTKNESSGINSNKGISLCRDNLPKEIDIDVIEKRIEEMNFLIYKAGSSKFEKENNSDKIFKLKQIKELKIVFYKNGMLIENYRFYEFSSEEGKQILSDIVDGYTPYIFIKDYPNGVPLKLIKSLNDNFSEQDDKNNKNDLNKVNYKKDKLSKDEFLNLLPKQVVRDGEVINLRENLERFFVVKKDNEKFYNEKDNEYSLLFDNSELDSVCKLKIQIGILDRIININIPKKEKIIKVFEFIKNLVNSNSASKINSIESFGLCSTYPFKQFLNDEVKDLGELGFFPSQFLIFKQNN